MFKLDIYCESAPLADEQVSYGLTRVMTAISHALSDNTGEILIFPVDGVTLQSHIDRQALPHTKLGSNVVAKIISKLQHKTPVVAQIIFRAWSNWCSSNQEKPSFLLAVIGANYHTLLRAKELASARKQKLIIYLVDDLITPAKMVGADLNLVQNQIKDALHSAHKIFCITEALSKRNKHLFGTDSSTLNLPFLPTATTAATESKRQFIYIGAINFLYASTLKAFITELSKYNAESSKPIELRLTVAREIAERTLGILPNWVVAEPIPDSGNLRKEIGASMGALLPYSFLPEHREMVETSFPSKLLDYLFSAKRIITIAPEYSSAANYFTNKPWMRIESLNFSIKEVVDTTQQQPNQQDNYRALLFKLHSLDVFRQQLIGQGSM